VVTWVRRSGKPAVDFAGEEMPEVDAQAGDRLQRAQICLLSLSLLGIAGAWLHLRREVPDPDDLMARLE
jgi:hypothetical protein